MSQNYSLTVYEKIFIVKYFYKLDEDQHSVWKAFQNHFPTEIPPKVFDLIPQIISTFEVTGSVLSDFYYERTITEVINQATSDELAKEEICYLNDQAVHEETVIANEGDLNEEEEDEEGEEGEEGEEEEEEEQDEDQGLEPETQLIVEGECGEEDTEDDEEVGEEEEEDDGDGDVELDLEEEEEEEDDSVDEGEEDSDEDYQVRPTPKKTVRRATTGLTPNNNTNTTTSTYLARHHNNTTTATPLSSAGGRRVRAKNGENGRKKSRSPRKPTQKKFCDVCQKFVGACFAEHMSTHSKSKDFVCKVCNKAFTTIRYLREHEFIHGEGTFVCEVCGKPSKTKSNHNSHMRVHMEKKFPCDQCPLTFKRQQGLTRHKMTHSGEKPFKCRQCGQEFAQHMTRQMHERLHTGERPYKCHHCNKSFIGAPALNVSGKFRIFSLRLKK